MATARQVTFNPSIWNGGWTGAAGTPGINGYDACSVYFDKDGQTGWAFEQTNEPNNTTLRGNGFARFNLSNGSIIFQGSFKGIGANSSQSFLGGILRLYTGPIQDDLGNYYVWYFDGTNTVFSKSHIASGPSNNIWNGYMIVDAIFTIAPSTVRITSWNNFIQPASDGNRYYSCININGTTGQRCWYVINTSSMSQVGVYTNAVSTTEYHCCFMDKFGDFWMIYSTGGGATSSFSFVKWHPQSGATGGNLNVTVSTVNLSPFSLFQGTDNGVVCTYVPSTHSVFLGTVGNTAGSAANVDLNSLTVSNSRINDDSFFTKSINAFLYSQQAASLVAVPDTSGAIGIIGAIVGSTTQSAGILNIIDPTTLAIKSTYNITQIINSQLGLTPVGTASIGGSTKTVPFISFQYRNGIALVSFNTNNDLDHGSPVYIVYLGLCGALAPLGNPLLQHG